MRNTENPNQDSLFSAYNKFNHGIRAIRCFSRTGDTVGYHHLPTKHNPKICLNQNQNQAQTNN